MSPLHKFIPPLLKQYRMVDGNALSVLQGNDVAAFLYGGFLCGAFDFVHSTYEELESLCGNHGRSVKGVRVEEDVHVHSSSSYLLYFYGLRTDVDCNKLSLL
ncbi:hypothetical protein POTOM_005612 [Populus tomentosa]|uniref:Uncharacterized protein n=1 Tax=Populus tomentosa TaxID=118781 RepID=A0A8X8AJM9_POPTO|nr:hypothetical protein POTOM_005612 [Populus tomentosa]